MRLQSVRPRWPRLSAGTTSRLNFLTDLALLVAISVALLPRALTGPELRTAIWMASIVASTWVVTAAALRHYAIFAYDRNTLDDTAMITTLVFAVTTVLAILELLAPAPAGLPRLSSLVPTLWAVTLLLRLGLFRHISAREEPTDDVLIVGIGPIGRLTAQDMRARGRHRIKHLRFADEDGSDLELLRRSHAGEDGACTVLANAADLDDVLRKFPFDEVYIGGNARRHGAEMQNAIRVCEKLGLPFALPAYSFRLERAQAVHADATSDGYLHYHSSRARPAELALKRLLDVVVSAFALWLLLPLLFTVAALIKLTSRGPVFFKQARVGLHARPFNMLKFRSMVLNAEDLKANLSAYNEQTGPVFKMTNDPRVTWIGRFIRRYSIDELPQLINVLRGDMSLVGPRPPLPAEVDKYEAWQRRRLSVRPGLTCIWQVSGRNQISFEEWMYLDMQYIDHWSLAQDVNLILRTVPVVITGRGAS